jgi:hypothetical protein
MNVFGWIQKLLWKLVYLPLYAIYAAIIGEGFRTLVPALGQKLWKIPGFGALKDYEFWHKMDLAPIMASFLFVAVCWLWYDILKLWLLREPISGAWNLDNREKLVVILGTVLLGGDAILFYCGVTQMGWGGSSFSFSALVATAVYIGVVIFVTYVSLNLSLAVYGE